MKKLVKEFMKAMISLNVFAHSFPRIFSYSKPYFTIYQNLNDIYIFSKDIFR